METMNSILIIAFALEEDGDKIADLMRNFLRKNVRK